MSQKSIEPLHRGNPRIHGAKSNKSSLTHILQELPLSLPWGFQLIKCQIHHSKLHQITLTNILSFEAFAAAVSNIVILMKSCTEILARSKNVF